MDKEWTLAENEAQAEWALPDGWHGFQRHHFERAQQPVLSVVEGSREISPKRVKRFLGFAPLRSAPLGMTGWAMGKEWTLAENDAHGEWIAARRFFGDGLPVLLEELNKGLAA